MAKGDWIKDRTAELVRFVKEQTEAGGAETKRRAAIAIANFEAGALWAEKALGSSDHVEGDDGGSGTGEPLKRVDEDVVPPLETPETPETPDAP